MFMVDHIKYYQPFLNLIIVSNFCAIHGNFYVFMNTFQTGLPGLYADCVQVILITFQTGLPDLYGVSVHVILITFQISLPGL